LAGVAASGKHAGAATEGDATLDTTSQAAPATQARPLPERRSAYAQFDRITTRWMDNDVSLTPWAELPRAQAIVAAVAHQAYKDMSVAETLEKLLPSGIFMDIKCQYDAAALQSHGAQVWRL
jgi:hypothetical protein